MEQSDDPAYKAKLQEQLNTMGKSLADAQSNADKLNANPFDAAAQNQLKAQAKSLHGSANNLAQLFVD